MHRISATSLGASIAEGLGRKSASPVVFANIRCFSDSGKGSHGETDANGVTEAEDVAAAGEASEGSASEAEATVEDGPEARIAALEAEIKEMKEKVIRSYAEEENVRRIAKRDVANAKQYANVGFAKSLLDVADNLDLALASVKTEEAEKDPAASFKVLMEGVEMTNSGLLKAFNQHGIEKFGDEGEKFDPNLHDAIFNMPDPSKEEGSIGQVIKKGYKMKDRVIRAAQVGTVSH